MMPILTPPYDPVLFREIRQLPTLLPYDENKESIQGIFYVVCTIAAIHLILLQIAKLWMLRDKVQSESADAKRADSLAAWKASYQFTNLLVNLTLGCLGIYYQMIIPREESIDNKIAGYKHVKLFAIGQMGYQLWALPIGIFVIHELKSMILHHVAVICVSAVSAFVHCGFRYYTPYFYGVIEISSVPLSIMNSFKSNKHWIKAYPEFYSAVRLIFGVTFLLVRVLLWTPVYWDFFTLATMLLYSSESTMNKVILTCFNFSSLVLTMLQYFWACKILSAMINGTKPEKKEN